MSLENRCGKAWLWLHKPSSLLEALYPSLQGITPVLMKWQLFPQGHLCLEMLQRLGRVEGRTEWITFFFPSSCKINKNAFFWFCFFPRCLCPKSLPNYHSFEKSQLQSCFQKYFCFALLPRSGDQSVIIYSTFVYLDNAGCRQVWTKPECLFHEMRQQA